MGICCCLLEPRTDSHQPEVLLIARVWSATRKLSTNGPLGNSLDQYRKVGLWEVIRDCSRLTGKTKTNLFTHVALLFQTAHYLYLELVA